MRSLVDVALLVSVIQTEYSNILTAITVRNNEAELKCNDYTDTKGMYAIYSNHIDYVGESITFTCQGPNHNGEYCWVWPLDPPIHAEKFVLI
jgi:hypothetical protein